MEHEVGLSNDVNFSQKSPFQLKRAFYFSASNIEKSIFKYVHSVDSALIDHVV